MLDADLVSEMEGSFLACVNPRDVIPISYSSAPPTQEEVGHSGDSVKLEMEEFSDLAPFLPESAQNSMENSLDELNTPIFERKGPFDFMVKENTFSPPPAADEPFEFEYVPIPTDSDQFSNINNKPVNSYYQTYNTDNFVDLMKKSSSNNSDVINVIGEGSEADMLFATSESDILIINGNETPVYAQSEDPNNSANLVKILNHNYSNRSDNCSVTSVNSNENNEYSNASSPIMESKVDLGIYTPENSNSCTSPGFPPQKPAVPKLTLGLLASYQQQQAFALSTPDVIESVVNLEIENSFLDYINSKDVTTVNIEDIKFGNPPETSTEPQVEAVTVKIERPVRSRRRTRKYEEEDEDYVPPSKKVSKRVQPRDEEESDDDQEEEEIVKPGVRDTRISSVSSDQSDVSKYRELRDKNNEASRKSRLKRKMREKTYMKEADQLEEKNLKLKAQVTELEKMVNNFRNNLFKIMLKK